MESATPRRIAFAGDFLRFTIGELGYASSQSRNIAWLYELMSGVRHAADCAGAQVEIVGPIDGAPLPSNSALERGALEAYRTDPEMAWAERYDTTMVDVLAEQFNHLAEFDLVIGFELPPTIKRHLNARGVRYVSFHVHALRLLRDLCMGASTNCLLIARALEDYVIPATEVDNQIRRFKALCRFRALPSFALPPGMPVLIGQTERDSILIERGRFVSWEDRLDALEDLLHGHDSVVFIEHPYRPDSRSIVETLRGRLGKSVISIAGNGYALLLSNPQIPFALTLASSLGVEAQAMGIRTEFLIGDPRQRMRTQGIDLGPDAALGHGVLGEHFIQVLLGNTKREAHLTHHTESFSMGENYIRASLDSWSYGLLQNGLAGATVRRILYPSATVDEARLQQTKRDLGDTGDAVKDEERRRTWALQHHVADRPLSANELRQIEFGQPGALHYLGDGFHTVEPWGAWSRERIATLRVAIDHTAIHPEMGLFVSLTIRAYEGLLAQCPVVRISHKDDVIGYAFFRPTTPDSRTLHFCIQPTHTFVEIRVEISDTESPSHIITGGDHRFLGIALSGIDLSLQPSDPQIKKRFPQFVDLGLSPEIDSSVDKVPAQATT